MYNHAQFLAKPGMTGPFGGLMDEYARAAEDFCRTVEAIGADAFVATRPSPDPDCVSIRAICLHVLNSGRAYANYLLKARKMPVPEFVRYAAGDLPQPQAMRGALGGVLRYTEASLDGLYDAPDAAILALAITVSWGPTMDPELLLEHAIVHLLRHRRQIERWK